MKFSVDLSNLFADMSALVTYGAAERGHSFNLMFSSSCSILSDTIINMHCKIVSGKKKRNVCGICV